MLSKFLSSSLLIWFPESAASCSYHFGPNLSGIISYSLFDSGSILSSPGNTSLARIAVRYLWCACLRSLTSLSKILLSSLYRKIKCALIKVLKVGSFNSENSYRSKTLFLNSQISSVFIIYVSSPFVIELGFLPLLIISLMEVYTLNLIQPNSLLSIFMYISRVNSFGIISLKSGLIALFVGSLGKRLFSCSRMRSMSLETKSATSIGLWSLSYTWPNSSRIDVDPVV